MVLSLQLRVIIEGFIGIARKNKLIQHKRPNRMLYFNNLKNNLPEEVWSWKKKLEILLESQPPLIG